MTELLITGGLGNLGSWTIDHLSEEVDNIVCVDMNTPPQTNDDIEFFSADLTDYGETRELIESINPESVVHLAAIPNPKHNAGHKLFENNTLSTYNVLDAAGAVGSDIVWASSVAAYGLDWAHHQWVPERLPISEDYRYLPQDPYGLSKVAGEEIAKRVTRRYGVSVVSLQPPWIQYPGEYRTAEIRNKFDLSTTDPSDPGAGAFWSYVDIRDVVRAINLTLQQNFDDHQSFIIAAENNFIDRNTIEAIESVYGTVPEDCHIMKDQSIYDCSKAEEILGWIPEHTWETAETESVEGPTFV